MQEILHDIVTAVLGDEAEVDINKKINDSGIIIYEITVAKKNMGKIIGKNGKIANAIRTVMKAYANRNNLRIFVQIIDNDSVVLI